jgi:cation diffusion facilitator CzcD-associated flavoprotein CzcO
MMGPPEIPCPADNLYHLDVYCFPFEGNPDWDSFYAGQAEIQAYIKRTAEKWDLTKHAQFNTTILETIWDEDSAKWKIKMEQGGEVKYDEADFLINGSGFLK